MLALFYDTETNGIPLFHERSSDPRQPHLVQLAAKLVDLEDVNPATGELRCVQAVDLIVWPDGWVIPDEVSGIHGIDTATANAMGVNEEAVVKILFDLWAACDRRIAHNEPFDARIIRIALKRYLGDAQADAWKAGEAECTMRLATPVCNLPPTEKMKRAGRHHPKSPTLSEVHEHLCGCPLENAHNALADVDGCIRVWKALQTTRVSEFDFAV